MIKTFQHYNRGVPCYEVSVINIETGDYNSFNYNILANGEILKFGGYESNSFDMGYSEPKQFLNRMKELQFETVENDFLDSYTLYNSTKYTLEQRQEFMNEQRRL
jgi:hypothetical protein